MDNGFYVTNNIADGGMKDLRAFRGGSRIMSFAALTAGVLLLMLAATLNAQSTTHLRHGDGCAGLCIDCAEQH